MSGRRCPPRARVGLAAIVGLALALALGLAGCSTYYRMTGVKIPTDLPAMLPVDLEGRIADHRTRESLRLLVFGDAGTGGADQLAVGRVMHAVCKEVGGCDLALVTGDLVYPVGVRPGDGRSEPDPRFEERFERAYRIFGRFDFWMVTGNHDWYRPDSPWAEIAYSESSDRWRMPALNYAVSGLPEWIAIYGIDTTLVLHGRGGDHIARAVEHLCSGRGWRILFGHHGVYAAGRYGDETGTISAMAEAVGQPLLDRCGVHFFFAGHDHLQAHLSTPGFEQVIQGAGGRRLYPVKADPRYPAGVSLLAAESAFGFALVQASAEELEVSFYRVEGGKGVAFHCRSYERVAFDNPLVRSVACSSEG